MIKTKPVILNNGDLTVKSSHIRAVIERVTEVTVPEFEHRMFVFEHLTDDHQVCFRKIQDWGCDDVTQDVPQNIRERIYKSLEEYYKTPYYI